MHIPQVLDHCWSEGIGQSTNPGQLLRPRVPLAIIPYKIPVILCLLLRPHLKKQLEILVFGLGSLERIQILAQIVLDMPIPAVAEEIFQGRDKLGIEVAGEAMARVFRENAHEHDRIVLGAVRSAVRSRQVSTNASSSLLRGGGARLGALDDLRQMDEFIALRRIGQS